MDKLVATIDAALLSSFVPFESVSPGELAMLSRHATLIHVPEGTRLVKSGIEDNLIFYLVSGRVEVTAQDRVRRIIDAGTVQAQYPLSRLNPHRLDVTALSSVSCIGVHTRLLDRLLMLDRKEADYCVKEMNMENGLAGLSLMEADAG